MLEYMIIDLLLNPFRYAVKIERLFYGCVDITSMFFSKQWTALW